MAAWMWISGLLTLAGVVILIVLLVRILSGGIASGGRLQGPPPMAGSSAEQILAERLARGDLTAEQYRELLKVLRGEPGGTG
ncbi:SHOCT domain-containing protein [Crystallibacter crystallopoietes]|nr:SHOCT domain-containing protein [Arthrobacter crystallopoietes]